MTQADEVPNAEEGGAIIDWSKEPDTTLLKTIAGIFIVVVAVSAAISEATEKLAGPLGEFIETMGKFAEPMARLGVDWRRCEILEEAGWLPHYTSPLDLVDEHLDATEGVDAKLEDFYRVNWPDIESRFIAMLEKYGIDDQAKEVFRQSLAAHASGFYALVPRALFPELERLSRVQFGKGPLEIVTSQHDLIQLAGNLPISDSYPGGLYALKLFERLIDHLYVKVTPQNLTQVLADPVPNRHAVMHGYASYDSYRSSLNALVMTDYIFQLLSTAMEDRTALAAVVEGLSVRPLR